MLSLISGWEKLMRHGKKLYCFIIITCILCHILSACASYKETEIRGVSNRPVQKNSLPKNSALDFNTDNISLTSSVNFYSNWLVGIKTNIKQNWRPYAFALVTFAGVSYLRSFMNSKKAPEIVRKLTYHDCVTGGGYSPL